MYKQRVAYDKLTDELHSLKRNYESLSQSTQQDKRDYIAYKTKCQTLEQEIRKLQKYKIEAER